MTTTVARDDLVRFLVATGHPPRIVPVSQVGGGVAEILSRLVPLTRDAESPEYASLLALAAAPDGPALLVVTENPELLPSRVADAVDFLPPDATPLQAAMRVRFVVGRRRSLVRARAEQARLSRDAITDFKTGLFNDRYFTERCREESARARRTRHALAIRAAAPHRSETSE